jgi:hypothetical protein
MQVLVILLIACFVLGGTPFGKWIRNRPVALGALSVVAAASYYKLGVVM